MIQIPKSQFKPKAFEYFRMVEETAEEIIITDHGDPVLKIIPITDNEDEEIAELRNCVVTYESPFEPVVPAEEWGVME